MKGRSVEAAKQEIQDALTYHYRVSERLGVRFERALNRALVDILEHPTAAPVITGEYRRARVKGFKYGVVYRIDEEGIVIIAVMHLHRNPDYWQGRV